MHSLVKTFPYFLLVPLIHAVSLPPQDLILLNLPNTTYPLYVNSNQTAFNLTEPDPVVTCGHARTPNLDLASCDNAWAKIPVFGRQGEAVKFRHRHENPPPDTVTLPQRWLSDDGRCAIDLKLNPGRFNYDTTNGEEVAVAAFEVLGQCVRKYLKGGTVTKFSEKSQIKITFSSYASQVQNVQCDAAPLVPEMTDDYKKSCEDALLYLPTNTKALLFNMTRTSSKIVFYILPRRDPDADGPILVDMPPDVGAVKAAWWDIWAAGVAVNTLCIKNGKRGTAFNLGNPRAIFIQLGL